MKGSPNSPLIQALELFAGLSPNFTQDEREDPSPKEQVSLESTNENLD